MDDVLGETHMIIQVREKTYLFIYYYKNCLFYVAYRKNIDPHRMIDVANSIKTLLDLSPDIWQIVCFRKKFESDVNRVSFSAQDF